MGYQHAAYIITNTIVNENNIDTAVVAIETDVIDSLMKRLISEEI